MRFHFNFSESVMAAAFFQRTEIARTPAATILSNNRLCGDVSLLERLFISPKRTA